MFKLNKIKNIKGFTLIEMILYVSLCSFILLSVSVLFSFLLGARVRSQAMTEVNQQGFYVMHMMSQTIRNATNVNFPPISSSSSSISITTKDAMRNPTLFFLSSTTLMVKEGSNQPVALTNSRIAISSLLFQNVSSASSTEKIFRLSFVVDYINKSGRSEYSFSKAFNSSATLR